MSPRFLNDISICPTGACGTVAKTGLSFIGLGFGYVSVSEVGFVFSFRTLNDNELTTNDT